jgi:DegV family protein with EDD domain
MPATVAVVTDSTAYLPPELLTEHGILVVPVSVVLGGQVHDETDVSAHDVAQALREWRPVTTSRPSPQRFADAYAELAGAGHEAIVSLHLSAELSATVESAWLAAGSSPVPVEVVDSRTIGMALGYAVVAASQAAATGADVKEVVAAAQRRLDATSLLFYVDTLEYLRRGGRIGTAAALVGSALSVKPLLHMVEGRVEPLEKVRTTGRALLRLADLAAQQASLAEAAPVDIAVHHLDNVDRAGALADSLRSRIDNAREVRLVDIGAVVGAHVGPGTIAVVVAPDV